MTLITTAYSWLRTNKMKTYLIGAVLMLAVLNLKQCGTASMLKKELAVSEHNIKALNDTIRLTTNKAHEPEFDKLAFLTDKVSNLEKLSTDLYTEVKKIKG